MWSMARSCSIQRLQLQHIYAVSMVHDHGYPIAFHIDGTGAARGLEKASREGIWWLPNQTANSSLVITNYTQKITPVNIAMRGATETGFRKTLVIGKGETIRLSIRQLRDEAGIS